MSIYAICWSRLEKKNNYFFSKQHSGVCVKYSAIQQCRNTQLQVKVLHWKYYLDKSIIRKMYLKNQNFTSL